MNRRDFISRTSSQLALFNLFGLVSTKSAIGEELTTQTADEASKGKIIYRTLGRTGIKVPIVNMGVMNATIPGLITRSYEKGVRLFDTAWFYQNGMNEKMLGEVVEQQGIRDDIIIMTKIYLKETERDLYTPQAKQLFLDRFKESLKRLKTDHVDILFHHAVHDIKY
jgi:aryl-alcohol dehydrogenase-like predicted oxidoreductase